MKDADTIFHFTSELSAYSDKIGLVRSISETQRNNSNEGEGGIFQVWLKLGQLVCIKIDGNETDLSLLETVSNVLLNSL